MKVIASIFIPTAKSPLEIRECLSKLSQQTVRNFELIIVSSEKSLYLEKLIKGYRTLSVHLIAQKRKGLVTAANDALKITKGDIFIRIDDDTLTSPRWLNAIIHTFSCNKRVGAVTGPTIVKKENIQARDSLFFISKIYSRNDFFYRLIRIIYNFVYENQIFAVGRFFKSGAFSLGASFYLNTNDKRLLLVDNVEACNFACKTDLLREVGGFDEIFNEGLGDYHEADIACKIRKLGYQIIFNPKAWVYHNVQKDTSIILRSNTYERIQNFIIFYKRHIRFKSLNHYLRFFIYITLQNCYYFYKFITSGNIGHLSSVSSTIRALLKY